MYTVRVKVLFFGMLRDIAGRSEEVLELPAAEPLGFVFDRYAQRFPRLREAASSVVLACNQQFSTRDHLVEDGDEIAFLPPVSGGSTPAISEEAERYPHEISDPEGHFFAITRLPIDTPALARHLLRGEDGAIVNFEGVVRNNTKGRSTKFLVYEGYEAMAVQTMAQIGREIACSMAVGRIAMVHRLGHMDIGETSVAVVVSAPHRRPAFDAALEGINRLKRLVPIWKKEHFADGEV
ncbi:MAG: molybdenum cofactor biosynthesis protein MoaE, partial [Acidobacteriaceae bacterium]|nr:molybdenum cofactor biosynthesis protein MoaE [Acidobacteriaceae bacterium]